MFGAPKAEITGSNPVLSINYLIFLAYFSRGEAIERLDVIHSAQILKLIIRFDLTKPCSVLLSFGGYGGCGVG